MRYWIKHTIVEMDESMIQRCIFCGEIICDYNNTVSPSNDPVKGYPAGNIFVVSRESKNINDRRTG